MTLEVKFGIPQPTDRIEGQPAFKTQGAVNVRLEDFPAGVLPSGGMSDRISVSELYMVQTCKPCQYTWRNGNTGEVIARAANATWAMVGRFPWEITLPGIFFCDLKYKGADIGFVEFEVT